MEQVYYSLNDLRTILAKHIIRGDRSDGIPNIHSPNDCFFNKIRQVPITNKIESQILDNSNEYCQKHNIVENYDRNKLLIDLSMIPESLYTKIIDVFKSQKPVNLFSTKKL